jgi:hypothetical protein
MIQTGRLEKSQVEQRDWRGGANFPARKAVFVSKTTRDAAQLRQPRKKTSTRK